MVYVPKNPRVRKFLNCKYCHEEFYGAKPSSLFCSKSCASSHRIHILNYKMPVPDWERITDFRQCIRTSRKYQNWRTSCYERDKYTCQVCEQRGGLLNVHHKIPFIKIISDYNITNTQDANGCSLLWDISNGITLCRTCHELEHYHLDGEAEIVSVN